MPGGSADMKIALLGDMAFFGKYSLKNDPQTVRDYFGEAARFLKEFDVVVGNLETPFFDGNAPFGYKSAHIKSVTANVELLKFLNVTAVNLANNHIFDHGLQGYRSTREVLDRSGIEYFGTDKRQLHIKRKGNKIALSGFCCYSTNACGYYDPRKGYGVNILDGPDVERTMKKNKEKGFFNITSFHWGEEHVHYPNYDHVLFARKLASRVPFVLYGHHPHVLQGFETWEGSFLAYSIGNFCFDDVYTDKGKAPLIRQSEANKRSVILAVQIENNTLSDYEVIPLSAEDGRLKVGKDQEIIENLKNYSLMLKEEESKYREFRGRLWTSYLESRKKQRNIGWYMKRMNFKSVGMIMCGKRNKREYQRCVRSYIKGTR